jgi:mono/diheme cytochrome c family protein
MRRVAAVTGLVLLLAAAGCGGDDSSPGGNGSQTAEDPVALGRELFVDTGCGDCHVLEAAGTDGATGPNLDELLLLSADASGATLDDHVRTAIVDPDAWVMPQFSGGVMPTTYGSELDAAEIDALVAFIVDAVQ